MDIQIPKSVHSTTACNRQEMETTMDEQADYDVSTLWDPLSPHKEASIATMLMTLENILLSDKSQLQKENKQAIKKLTHILILLEENFSNKSTQRQLRSVWPVARALGVENL